MHCQEMHKQVIAARKAEGRWYKDKDFPDNEDVSRLRSVCRTRAVFCCCMPARSEEAWYYMPQGHMLRRDNETSEAQRLSVDQSMDEDLAKVLEENNVLQAGSLPAVHAATEAGEKTLLALFEEPGSLQKRAPAKQKKDAEVEAEEMKPKTLKEFLACMASMICSEILVQLMICMRLWILVLRQVIERRAEILRDSTEARKTSITLTNLNYGGDLSEQLLKFSKKMELAYKRLGELQKQEDADARIKKVLRWVDKKNPWFKQAQALAVAVC